MEFKTKNQLLIFLRDAGREVTNEVIENLRCDPLNTAYFSDNVSVDERLSELREADFSLLRLAVNDALEDFEECEEETEEYLAEDTDDDCEE